MKPITLTLENFLSYIGGEHVISFDGVTLAALTGPNGAGKSSLVDAMRYALFGATRGGADSMITEGRDSCRVEFIFQLRDEVYRVMRSRSRKGGGTTLLTFAVERAGPVPIGAPGTWVPLDGKTVRETQQRIEQVTGLNDHLFTMTACAAQGRADEFALARPGERKDVLAEILELSAWERYEAEARRRGKEIEAETASIEREIEAARERAARREEIVVKLDQARGQDADVANRLEQAESQAEQARKDRETLVADQRLDAERRRQRDELADRVKAATAECNRLTGESSRLAGAAAAQGAIAKQVEDAEAAEKRAAFLEQVRRDRDALSEKITVEQGLVAQAMRQHEAAIKQTERRGQDLRKAHADKVAALQKQAQAAKTIHQGELRNLDELIKRNEAQAAVMDEVPCTHLFADGRTTAQIESDTPYELGLRHAEEACADCSLLAQARIARAELETLRPQREALAAEQRWAATEAQIKAAVSDNPAAEYEQQAGEMSKRLPEEVAAGHKRIKACEAEREALIYDEAKHQAARGLAFQLPALRQRLQEAAQAAARVEEITKALARAQTEHGKLVAELADFDDSLGGLIDWSGKLAEMAEALACIAGTIQGLRTIQTNVQQRLGALERDLAEAEAAGAKIEELETNREAFHERAVITDLLVKAFGSNGVPAALIDEALPEIERVANEHLEAMTDGQFWVSLRTQREKRSGGGMMEVLDVVIIGPNGERLFENFSGGERVKVSVALRFALAALLAGRAGANILTAIIDEGVAPLDDEGRTAFMESCMAMANRGLMILVVTHDPRVKELAPFQYQVTKDASGSHVEMVAA